MMAYTLPRLMPLMRLLRILKTSHLFFFCCADAREKLDSMAKTSAATSAADVFAMRARIRDTGCRGDPGSPFHGFPGKKGSSENQRAT